jgi:GNAT superfamily N-acetyltransferase
MALSIRLLERDDCPIVSAAFRKPSALLDAYLAEQERGERSVLLAIVTDVGCVGFGTIVWNSPYAPFNEDAIPEIKDLNVLPARRRQGIGTALMDAAEQLAGSRSSRVGIGVGMDAGYGPAQALYVARGYVPDGRGLTTHNRHVAWGETVRVDDDLVLYLVKRLRSGLAVL